jgi:hypothetical protein
MKYFRSKIGEVRSEASWRSELDEFWKIPWTYDKTFATRPDDAWERYVKVLGLVEIEHEDVNNGSGYDGVF